MNSPPKSASNITQNVDNLIFVRGVEAFRCGVLTIGLFLILQESVMASEGNLAWEARTSLGDTSEVPTVFVVLLIAILLLGLWSLSSSGSSKIPSNSRRVVKEASNLYLTVGLSSRVEGGSVPMVGAYLQSLGLRRASLVVGQRMEVGERVWLDLASLPGFPGAGEQIELEVLNCRPLKRSREDYAVRLKFVKIDEQSILPLGAYLRTLSKRQLNHAR